MRRINATRITNDTAIGLQRKRNSCYPSSRMSDESVVDVPKLAALLRARRASRGLREVADEIKGVSASTLSRLEQGNMPDLETFARLCAWLRVSANDFVLSERTTSNRMKTPTPEFLEAHLRAERVLPPKAIDALAEMIRMAYQAAKHGQIGKTAKG